ncbi:unnamed protein product [Brachionus calyciflorus]|uniref:Uncharacterized protein n=1 Tax=Brachionus calyciflorus TaxID=104777 RepID=A0A813W8H0_9BILA|nr:unnamed protein product [Brachionus calyciflorus]
MSEENSHLIHICRELLDKHLEKIFSDVDERYIDKNYTLVPSEWYTDDTYLNIHCMVELDHKIIVTFQKNMNGYNYVKTVLQQRL